MASVRIPDLGLLTAGERFDTACVQAAHHQRHRFGYPAMSRRSRRLIEEAWRAHPRRLGWPPLEAS
jgi:hypothetical protein